MVIKTLENGLAMVEFPGSDTFARETATDWGYVVHDLISAGRFVSRVYCDVKRAAQFARHCE